MKQKLEVTDPILATLLAYKRHHEREYPRHYVWIYGNYTECQTCKDHAHYIEKGKMHQHDSGFTVSNFVELEVK